MLDDDVLRRITTERNQLRADLAAAARENTGLAEEVATLTRDLAVTVAERDTFRRRLDEVLRDSAAGNA